jgi:superfamily II DNA or RNA helicase
MKIIVTNKTELVDVPASLGNDIRRTLTVKNPAHTEAQKMNRWTGNIPEHIHCFDETAIGCLSVPRGFTREVATMANQHNAPFECIDNTRELPPVEFTFNGTLRPYQDRAATAILKRRFGVAQMPTGAGKTIVALYIIAIRGQPTLIIVHTKELLNQWVDRIHSFLGIPVDEIGIIGGGKMRIGDRITVAMVQTLYKCKDDVYPQVSHLVVDEAHRQPSRIFSEAVTAFDTKFMLGLTATAYRRDGLDNLISWHLGERVHSVAQAELTDNGAILPFKVKWVKTEYETDLDPSNQYTEMLSELTQNDQRNRLICREAAAQVRNGGGIPMILSDRKQHCKDIAKILDRDHGITPTILTGDLSKKAREKVVAKLNAGDCEALISTTALLSEGFDCPALGTVLLATPVRFRGRLIQSIGRALRPSPGQDHATVVDFEDTAVGVLKHSAMKRRLVYRDLNAIEG